MQISAVLRRAQQVAPKATATIHLGRQKSWSEFLYRVQKLAGAFRKIGVKNDDRIAFLGLNSDRYIEYFFASVWAGAAMMPLNIRWSSTEITYALNDSEAGILIVDDAFIASAEAVSDECPKLEKIIFSGDGFTPDGMLNYEEILSNAAPVEDAGRKDDDLAGIFYTGGTTGFPKGVMLSHKNFFVGGISNAQELKLKDGSVYLHAAPMFHIADLLWFVAVTYVSGTHVSVPEFTPADTLAAIEKHRPSHVLLVPAMIFMVLQSHQLKKTDVSSVELIAYGASPITEAVLEQAFRCFPNAQFLQAFGQTELAPVATILDTEFHTESGLRSGKLRSCGRATRVCEIRIVDENDRDVELGQIGQIIVRGPITMLGYWKKPELTKETIKNGWVYTGDAGYMDADGFVYLMDRLKDMIISGGENIYSTEVENALASHPSVSTCAVIGVPDEKWGEAVHAIVILNSGHKGDEKALKEHCRQLIAAYKCPREVSFRLEPFPLSGANKILKTELRKPFWLGKNRQIF